MHAHSESKAPEMKYLSRGAQLFTKGVREWARAKTEQTCGCCAIRGLLREYRIEEASHLLNELMCLIATIASRPLEARPTDSERLAEDELFLIEILRAVEAGDPETAYELAGNTFPGPLATTVFRVARAFLDVISDRDFFMTGPPGLALVATHSYATH